MNDTQPAPEPHPAAHLLGEYAPSLAGWYGDPLAPGDAAALLQVAERALQFRLSRGGARFPVHLLQLICRYWLGADGGLHYRHLAVTTADATDGALLELAYGQLLISRKLRAATAHLEQGFARAARQLASADYFTLVRRHEALGNLVLGEAPCPPQPLQALLAEAAVTRRLRGPERYPYANGHRDTLG
jgi:hypothetical protein